MYFWGAQVASIQSRWAFLRENATQSVPSPFTFYSPLLQTSRIYGSPLIFPTPPRSFFRFSLPIFLLPAQELPSPFVCYQDNFIRGSLEIRPSFITERKTPKPLNNILSRILRKEYFWINTSLVPPCFMTCGFIPLCAHSGTTTIQSVFFSPSILEVWFICKCSLGYPCSFDDCKLIQLTCE